MNLKKLLKNRKNTLFVLFIILLVCFSLFLYIKKSFIVLLATGDVVLARSINYKSVKDNDFFWPFEKVKSLFKLSDMVLINLEGTLVKNCPVTKEKIAVFCGDERHAQGIAQAGINVVNIANNHILDYGKEETENTIRLLKKENVLISGSSQQAAIKSVNGIKFAFLGFNDIDCQNDFCETEKNIITQIKKATQISDVVIVSFHWGEQYTDKITDRQRFLGRLAVDNGADIIIGHHPHWIQPVETYKGKPIVYSHGNFVFDQQWSEETRRGVISNFVFFGNKLVSFDLISIYINDFGSPETDK